VVVLAVLVAVRGVRAVVPLDGNVAHERVRPRRGKRRRGAAPREGEGVLAVRRAAARRRRRRRRSRRGGRRRTSADQWRAFVRKSSATSCYPRGIAMERLDLLVLVLVLHDELSLSLSLSSLCSRRSSHGLVGSASPAPRRFRCQESSAASRLADGGLHSQQRRYRCTCGRGEWMPRHWMTVTSATFVIALVLPPTLQCRMRPWASADPQRILFLCGASRARDHNGAITHSTLSSVLLHGVSTLFVWTSHKGNTCTPMLKLAPPR
jgi:hypothetical protein